MVKSHANWKELVLPAFKELSNVWKPETKVERIFRRIVSDISVILENHVQEGYNSLQIGVGGLLVEEGFDYRSVPDSYFELRRAPGGVVLATEAKISETFPPSQDWYQDSRAIQTLCALYAYNAPTFLYSSRSFKLFVENKERDTVFTFPFHDEDTSSDDALLTPAHRMFLRSLKIHEFGVYPTEGDNIVLEESDEMFLDLIILCLIGKPGNSAQYDEKITEAVAAQQSRKRSRSNGSAPPSRPGSASSQKPDPKILVGRNNDGSPIYRQLYVYPCGKMEEICEELGLPSEEEESDDDGSSV
jgi:hypothetical protein